MSLWSVTIVVGLAALLGMTAHRASLCTVKAVAEVLTTQRGYMLVSFAKTVLWVLAITTALAWLGQDVELRVSIFNWSLLSAIGGLLFGVGAAVNGGCAFSTLTRLASGRFIMALSFAGFCLGLWVVHSLRVLLEFADAAIVAPPFDLQGLGGQIALVGVWMWVAWEVVRLIRTRPRNSGRILRAARSNYRLSTAAAIIGISNGFLLMLVGSWAYTNTLGQAVQSTFGIADAPRPLLWLLFASLLFGATFSALSTGRFRSDWSMANWRAHLIGGALMGAGAASIPGGNDALLLQGIPALSPHAVPAFAAMLSGIAVALLIMKHWLGSLPRVDCAGDICVEIESVGSGS